MATLREYFEKDQGSTFCLSKPFMLRSQNGEALLEVQARLHIDFEANASYISFFIPHTEKVACPSRILLNSIADVLKMREDVYMEEGFPGQDMSRSEETVFTGRIYLYTEDEVTANDREYIYARSCELGHSVKIKSNSYVVQRSSLEKPLAFISHDSRDKNDIAKPLAMALQKMMCPVWYDEFSLRIGDSLRASIEKGLKECQKCVFVITPNFLANGGWVKREYDSIFTRELVEAQNVILPVWANVNAKDVYAYSPILADRVALVWEGDVEKTARKLANAIRSQQERS